MRLALLSKVEDAHEDAVWTAAWSGPEQLLTGSVDENVKVWTEGADGLESLHTYTGHTLGVISVVVDPSGTYAASSALDSFIRVWNLHDTSTKAVIETQPSETWSVTFAQQPGAEGPLLLAAAGVLIITLAEKVNQMAAIKHELCVGGSSNKIKIWNVDNSMEQSTLSLPAAEDTFKKETFVLSVAQSPDGKWLASGSMDGTVAVFDATTGQLLHTLDGHFKPVRSLCFTPDSNMLVTACDDMLSHLYDVKNGSLIDAFSGHESWVLSVAMHPSGTAFATGSSDSKVKLWDLQTRSCLQTVADHADQVWCVAFRADGRRLVSVSDDKSIALYDVE